MKLLVAVVAVSLSYPAYADHLVGIATLTHASETKYQPGSCESQPREPSDQGLACIDFTYWMRYRLEDFTDLKGERLPTTYAVMATHLPRRGRWLVVLEKLKDDEQKEFRATYRIVDGAGTFEVACLDKPLKTYLSATAAEPLKTDNPKEYCYDLDELSRDDR